MRCNAGGRRYVKRRIYAGDVLEQTVFKVHPNTKNLRRAQPAPPRFLTDEDRRRYNDAQSLRRFCRDVNANFGPWSWFVTLTCYTKYQVVNFPTAYTILGNYIKRLQYENPEVKVVAVMGRGKKSPRIHFHLIVSGVDRKIISKKWWLGRINRIEPLREHNYYDIPGKGKVDHGRDYTGLATYLHNHWTAEQGQYRGKRWRATKNLDKPESPPPKEAVRKYSENKPPVTPQGYMLVQSNRTPYGYLYFKYVRIPKGGMTPMKC